jgi:hypothetical protein
MLFKRKPYTSAFMLLISRVTGKVKLSEIHLGGYGVNQDLVSCRTEVHTLLLATALGSHVFLPLVVVNFMLAVDVRDKSRNRKSRFPTGTTFELGLVKPVLK